MGPRRTQGNRLNRVTKKPAIEPMKTNSPLEVGRMLIEQTRNRKKVFGVLVEVFRTRRAPYPEVQAKRIMKQLGLPMKPEKNK